MKSVTIRRKLMMLGAGGTLALAGAAGAVAHGAHASTLRTAPAITEQAGVDATGGVQQQVGLQTAGPDATEAAPKAAEGETAASTETDAPGGANVQSGANIQSGSGLDSGTNG